MPTGKALEMAREQGLDLVEVAPSARPPVRRILDYGKLRYLTSKKEREAKKSQRSTGLREVRFRPKIGEHDFSSKVRKVKELIGDGAKVKVAVVFRGISLLKRVAELVQEDAKLEGPPGMEGRSVSMMLTPAVKKIPRKAEPVANAQAQDT